MNINFCLMGFSKGTISTEAGAIKRYIGVAPVKVLAVNPSKSELESIYNTTLENAPEYVSEKEGIKSARIDFIVATDPEKCDGIDFTTKVAFFVRDEFRFNKDKTKVQVIDKYGRTAWVTKEQCEKHEIPMYANGPANLDSDYRPCYIGEEDLTNFVKAYLNIPNVMKYVDSKWVLVDKPEECEARLGAIKNMFAGDFKEIQEIASYQPNNKVKVLFGVRTTDDGKQYQSAYTQMVLKNSVNDYSKLDADVKERKNSGAYATTEFEVCPIKEYKVAATDFNSSADDLPVGADANPWFK